MDVNRGFQGGLYSDYDAIVLASCTLNGRNKGFEGGVTFIFRFETEEHDNVLKLYGEFSWKGVS